jgi:CubicO group peptidase (beta-lactamase class C family)
MISFFERLETETEPYLLRSMTEQSTNVNNSIGLGFQLYSAEGERAIGHYGGDKGFRSFLLMVPDEKIGLVLLANCDYHEDFRQEILFLILRKLLTY